MFFSSAKLPFPSFLQRSLRLPTGLHLLLLDLLLLHNRLIGDLIVSRHALLLQAKTSPTSSSDCGEPTEAATLLVYLQNSLKMPPLPTFASPCPVPHTSRSHQCRAPRRPPPGLFISVYACAPSPGTHSTRVSLQHGIKAALEDYVTSGTNIAIGGRACSEIAEALSIQYETGALTDCAFIGASPSARAAIADASLPTDASVNHGAVDVFLSCADQVDDELNVVLTADAAPADALRAERAAAALATRAVVIVREADFEAAGKGLLSFPVVLAAPFVKQTAGLVMNDPLLRDMGVRDLVFRGGGEDDGDDDDSEGGGGGVGCVADVLLRPNSDILAIDTALCDMPGVSAVGVIRASEKVTAVVSGGEDDVYDVTSSLCAIAELSETAPPDRPSPSSGDAVSEDDRFAGYGGSSEEDVKKEELKALSLDERQKVLEQLGERWSFSRGATDCLEREFDFATVQHAHAFIARLHLVARLAGCFPDVRQCGHCISVSLTTRSKEAVTELDVAIARQLCAFHERLSSYGR